MISLQIKPWVAFGFPYLLIEIFYIGIPVVRTDGRTVTWLPNFLGWVDYHISLAMGPRPRARFARGWSSAISLTVKLESVFEHSLRADDIKLCLNPSAKQRRNPCSGLPAVYPDLSTHHDWPVKKGLCFVCRDRQSGWRGIWNALPVIRWVRWGSRTRISALLGRRY